MKKLIAAAATGVAILTSSVFAAAEQEFEAGEKAIYHLSEAYRLLDELSIKDKERLRLRIFYVGEHIKSHLKNQTNQNTEEKK